MRPLALRFVAQIRLLPVRAVADLLMDYMSNLPPRPQGPPLDIQARQNSIPSNTAHLSSAVEPHRPHISTDIFCTQIARYTSELFACRLHLYSCPSNCLTPSTPSTTRRSIALASNTSSRCRTPTARPSKMIQTPHKNASSMLRCTSSPKAALAKGHCACPCSTMWWQHLYACL